MFYEYALDPAILTSWERARYFLEAFGPWKGRFMVRIPAKWKKLAYEQAARSCREIELKWVEQRLADLADSVFAPRTGIVYEPTRTWLENAEAEHARKPMRAVITVGTTSKDHVLDAASLDERNERWRVEPGASPERDPRAFAEALSILLAASTRFVIVDPYFRADQSHKAVVLRSLCALLRGRAVSIDVHVNADALPFPEAERHAKRALPSMIPRGLKVTLHGWRERAGGRRFHNRFILTDCGGVQFGDSLERGDPGQDDRVSIMGAAERAEYVARFHGTAPAFDPIGQVEILGECD